MKKRSMPQEEIEYCYICLPAPFEWCYNVVMAAVTPLILVVQGESGVGKSLFAARLVNEYLRKGYSARVLITEQYRIASVEYYADPKVVFVVKEPQNIHSVVRQKMEEMYKEDKEAQGFFIVIDSIANVVAGPTKVVGARWSAQRSILEAIITTSQAEKRYSVPTVAILLDQYRQGPPVPGTMITSARGTLPTSLRHCATAVFRLRNVRGQDNVVELSSQHYVMSPVETVDGNFIPSNRFTPIHTQPVQVKLDDLTVEELIIFHRSYKVINAEELKI